MTNAPHRPILRAVNVIHPTDPDTRPGPLAVATASAVLAVFIASFAWVFLQARSRADNSPGDVDLAAAERLLTAEVKAGDAFAIIPGWAAAQRWRFARVWRDKGLSFEDAMQFGDPLDSWDVDGFKRLWILTTHGHDAGLDGAGLGPVVAHHSLGHGTALTLVRVKPSRTVFDFRERLLTAAVTRVSKDGKVEKCSAGVRQDCSGEWWRDVYEGMHEVGNTRRRCLFVQPYPSEGELHIEYTDLPPGDALEGRFGNRLWAVRHDSGSDVVFRVLVAGKERFKLQIARDDFRWHKWRVKLRASERKQDVTFVVSAVDVSWRQACFDARLLGRKPNK